MGIECQLFRRWPRKGYSRLREAVPANVSRILHLGCRNGMGAGGDDGGIRSAEV